MTDNENKYWAFLSYSQQDNREQRPDAPEVSRLCWGDWLHDIFPWLVSEGMVKIGPIPKGTPVSLLTNMDIETDKLDLVDRAVAGTSAELEPVWRGDGPATLRRWRGADDIEALTRALKDRCL